MASSSLPIERLSLVRSTRGCQRSAPLALADPAAIDDDVGLVRLAVDVDDPEREATKAHRASLAPGCKNLRDGIDAGDLALMGRRRFVYSAEGTVSPERFISALTDFSEDRPRYWPGMTANQFRLIQKGKDWALVREGTGLAWEQSRYDWSKPGLVVSTVEESNFLKPGTTWEVRISHSADGGCRVDAGLE